MLTLIHALYSSPAGPGPPTGVTVQAESCHTLNVTWSPPDPTGGLPITGYNISYTDTRTSDMLYGYSNTTMKSLQQLKPGTQYIVRVRAMNAIGEGNFTQESSGNTEARGGYLIHMVMLTAKPYKRCHHFQFLFVLYHVYVSILSCICSNMIHKIISSLPSRLCVRTLMSLKISTALHLQTTALYHR